MWVTISQVGINIVRVILCQIFTINLFKMAKEPSYNGLGSPSRPVLTINPRNTESKVTTKNPSAITPSPRGHA